MTSFLCSFIDCHKLTQGPVVTNTALGGGWGLPGAEGQVNQIAQLPPSPPHMVSDPYPALLVF